MATVISGDTGVSQVQAGSINQDDLAANVVGKGPAFSAYPSGTGQVVGAASWTKVRLDTEEFDANNSFDSTTNYRFQPNVAGYYLCTAAIQYVGDTTTGAALYKNGSAYKVGYISSANQGRAGGVSALVFLNGSTDYVEFFAYCSVTGTVVTGLGATWFQGVLVRAA